MAKDPMIKKSRRGLLHKKLGVAPDKKIPLAKEEKAAHSSSPKLREEAQFALNFNKEGRAAHKQAMKDFGDKEIAHAAGQVAHEQAQAAREHKGK